MDCYPEYKHHIHPNHQHYNSNVAANHSYYPGNYGPTSMRYSHAHSSYPEGSQQPNWAEGYSRYNHAQHHLNHQGNYSTNNFNGHYGPARENYHANGEVNGQFYYQNAHQTSASYYGNHSYDSYRNASSAYPYHYGGAYHQTASNVQHPPNQYYPSYNSPSTEQFNNRYYPTPPPSAPPTSSSQRDPFQLAHSSNGSPSSSSSSYAPTIESELNESLKKEERLSIESGEKSCFVDRIESLPSKERSSSGSVDENCKIEVKAEVQQTELESSSSPNSATPNENEKPRMECANEVVKVEGTLDSAESKQKHENHQQQQQQSPSLFNETGDHNQQHHHPCNETLPKPTVVTQDSASACEAESSIATDYQYQQTARDLQNHRHRKSLREKEKCLKGTNVNRKLFDMNTNANDPFNRCSTPFVSMPSSPFNHNHMPPHSYPPHQRLPPNFPHAAAAQNYWYSQHQQHPSHPHHHNWMMNPYMRNRRGSYTDAQMLPSSLQYNRNVHSEKLKVYEEASPPPKRTKRKPKPDPPSKHDPKDEIMKNVTPLPGFLQTFGGTEIGRFSEAFFTSSESPNPYYNNSIESDVESPQPWDFDSLDGPLVQQVGAAFQVYGSETEYDSPINNFSELMCNDY